MGEDSRKGAAPAATTSAPVAPSTRGDTQAVIPVPRPNITISTPDGGTETFAADRYETRPDGGIVFIRNGENVDCRGPGTWSNAVVNA